MNIFLLHKEKKATKETSRAITRGSVPSLPLLLLFQCLVFLPLGCLCRSRGSDLAKIYVPKGTGTAFVLWFRGIAGVVCRAGQTWV